MKNKLLALICATLLSVCCLGLAACGGGTSSASGSAASASSAADPTAKFIGEWQMAGAKTQGITVAGDFSAMFGQDLSLKMDIKDAGKGSITFNNETKDITWEASGDDAIVIKPVADAASGSAASASASASSASASSSSDLGEVTSAFGGTDTDSLNVKYEDEALVITSTDSNNNEINIIFTADGKIADMPEISASALKDVASEKDAIGEWTISGMNLMGATMYGDMAALAQQVGGSSSGADMTLVIEEGGKAKLMGQDAEWTFDSSKGLQIGDSTAMVPVKALGDDLALDMSEMVGMDMIMVFSK